MAGARGAAVVLGIDIGTTSVKAAACDPGGIILSAEIEYPLESPGPDRAEQDADTVLTATLDALGQVAAAVQGRGAGIAGVAFSSVMHSLLGLDRAGDPITPVVTYADNRAQHQASALREDPAGLAVYRRTGTPIHPMSPLLKLRWFAEQDPGTCSRVERWVGIKEYLLSRLFGTCYLDHSVASATGMFNLADRDWDGEALELAGVTPDQLGTLVPTTHVLEGLSGEHAQRLCLDRDTPFVIGAGDGVLANVGVGAVTGEVVVCSVGTSGAVRAVVREPTTDARGRTFCYALSDDRWVVGGATSNGGIVLRWVRDVLLPDVAEAARSAGDDPYESLVALAGKAPAGAGGLLFLPYLTGERAPYWSSLPRGVLFGLQRRHGREHIVRAALEGVMLQLSTVLRLLEEGGIGTREVRATGGFAVSTLWRQIMADVFGRAVTVPLRYEGSAFGAALLGMLGLGLVDSLDSAEDFVQLGDVLEPDPRNAGVYEALRPIYERLYDDLTPAFAALAGLQHEPPPEPGADHG